MKKRLEHPFFDHLDEIAKRDLWNVWQGVKFPKTEFFQTLKQAHPFVFDDRCTEEGIRHAGIEVDSIVKVPSAKHEAEIFERQHAEAKLVEEFSLRHSISLYLLTNCMTIVRNARGGQSLVYKRIGYLLKEINPEKIRVWDLMLIKPTGPEFEKHQIERERFFPAMDYLDIDLKNPDPNLSSDILSINRFTNMMNVKRLGIEKTTSFRNVKSKGIGSGYTSVKFDNIIHIADKEEYEYTHGLAENVKWDYRGFWSGHWRALYFSPDITDTFGRRVVDYSRKGKNRKGEYVVDGYTWVTEHVRGDPAIAEIKTHFVKAR